MKEQFSQYEFKYAPEKFDELILNENLESTLKKTLIEAPSMILHGIRGIGKGSFTHVFLKETKFDYIWLNAGMKGGIDVIRDFSIPGSSKNW